MKRRTVLKNLSLSVPGIFLAQHDFASGIYNRYQSPETELGPFRPTWKSLENYKVPEWFRNAKFGMWAHWGPQCQPERGDWYAREMYKESSPDYKYHKDKYGHPSVFGFKDVINEWKAEKWDPEELVSLYKNTGAKYFMAMANHHDNLDLYKSTYQPNWNSTKVGPKKDIIAGWAKAARANGLPFGVSVHASHAWLFYETAQSSDKTGSLAGVPYDGKMTKADGEGKWWEGHDPQELYAQNHALSVKNKNNDTHWNWGNGATQPSKDYIDNFYNRTIELIDKYEPDMVYFDDSQLPFWPIHNAGLLIAAHMYNKSVQDHGQLQAVITGKVLDENQRKAMVWDIERGQANSIQPIAWQTDTCIGSWHYNRSHYYNNNYKSAETVVQMLVDIVSKNGNLMLNIPVRGDGSIDELERKIVEGIGDWMRLNSESIYETRPWKIFGEGPKQEGDAKLTEQGFNEGRGKPFTSEDVRFVIKGDVLYATVMGWPDSGKVTIKSLALGNDNFHGHINRVELVSTKQLLKFERTKDGLTVHFPESKPVACYANALKIV